VRFFAHGVGVLICPCEGFNHASRHRALPMLAVAEMCLMPQGRAG
jgi:hypothetical protein